MRIAFTKDDISSIFTPGMLACAFAYAALKLVGSMTNGYLYPLWSRPPTGGSGRYQRL